ncbi:MAG TPA: LysR family transcriptional regulator [Burkholderiales bacterium]
MLPSALQYFRDAVQAGSIRRAAEKLGVAPSAISRQVARLEAELGLTLLDRRARGLHLTEAGRMVLAYAERSGEQYAVLREGLQGLAGGRAGEVRVATVEGVVSYFLSKYIGTFEQRHPGLRVQVSVLGSRSVLETLREGGADIALAFGVRPGAGFVQHARLDQPLCVIVAADHPLARRKSLSFADIAGARVALPDRSFEIRARIDRMAKRTGTDFVRVIETNSLEMAKGAVRNSDLLTFLPRYAALRDIASRELAAVPLRDRPFADTSVTLLTARAHQLSPAGRLLLDALKTGMASYRRTS